MRVFIAIAFFAVALADLPNHCLREHVAGEDGDVWTITMGPNTGDKTIQCHAEGQHNRFEGVVATSVTTLNVTLDSTDFVATMVDLRCR